MTYYYTYKITCLLGTLKGKYYYGQHTSNIKVDSYTGSGAILVNYFKKYPKIEGETYIKEILCYYDSKEELDNAEIELIGDKYKTDKMCLNLIKGGRQSSINEAAHKRMSDKAKKRTSPMKNKKHTDKAKELNRQKHLGKTHPSYTGWHQNEETKQIISESGKDKIVVNNGKKEKRLREYELNDYLENGWKLGGLPKKFSEQRNKAISESSKNHHWINNGIKQTHVSEDKLQKYLDDGWVLGPLRKVA